MTTDAWDAKTYAEFLDLRTRPARDLLAAIPTTFEPNTIYDLGCGPGNSTILLKDRWPKAKLVGIDSSLSMLEEAKKCYPDISFIHCDIANFSPIEKIDLLFASASLQWLDKHETLIPKLFQFMNIGAIFSIQMPNNFHSPSHQVIIKILQKKIVWRSYLKRLRFNGLVKPFYSVQKYYDLLIKIGAKSLQLWETEYFQEMSSHQEIFHWVKGTGLRPFLSEMDVEDQNEFADEYINAISKEYPLQPNNKILLPFRRIFMVGYK